MDTVAALSKALDQMQRVANGVTADQMANATPCSEWDVRALLGHAFGVVGGMTTSAAGGEPAPFELDENDIAGQFRTLADASLVAWRAPGVLERELNGGAGPMPGAQYATINTLDTLVHAWDLARGTGQDAAMPEDIAAHALAACESFITPEIRQFAGFSPAVTVPANASSTDKLVAFLGREP